MFKFFPFSGEAEVGEVKNDTGSFIHISREREKAPGSSSRLTATHKEADGDRDAVAGSTRLDYEFDRDAVGVG
jgi:hypothetical protein